MNYKNNQSHTRFAYFILGRSIGTGRQTSRDDLTKENVEGGEEKGLGA